MRNVYKWRHALTHRTNYRLFQSNRTSSSVRAGFGYETVKRKGRFRDYSAFVIPAKAGIQESRTGCRIMSGMTTDTTLLVAGGSFLLRS